VTTCATPPPAAFEAAFESCPVAQAVVDPDGTLQRVNAAFAALLGYRVDELTGRRYQDLTPSEDLALDEEATRRLRAGEESRGRLDKRLLHRNGTAVWVRVSATPLWDTEGRSLGGVATVEPLHPEPPGNGSGAVDGRAYWLTLHDVLTGAANRLLLHDRIALALAACARGSGVVALLFCDIDSFKQINDTFGHERGDQVLTAVVRRLQVTVRPDDTVARLGGDELVVVSHVDDAGAGHALQHRVRDALARPLQLPAGRTMDVGVSVGLAVGDAARDGTELLAEADRAMYGEKNRRRLPRLPAPR
jgi:diguanylate cyclase (GGDEF)-like protein/PAS domain S-box-containing protein